MNEASRKRALIFPLISFDLEDLGHVFHLTFGVLEKSRDHSAGQYSFVFSQIHACPEPGFLVGQDRYDRPFKDLSDLLSILLLKARHQFWLDMDVPRIPEYCLYPD